jgi:hypothetical protein
VDEVCEDVRMMEFLSIIQTNMSEFTLAFGIAVMAIILIIWQLSDKRFDLREVLIDGGSGRVSLYKVGQFTALLVSTWILMFETEAGRMNEWLFTMYMFAWAGANSLNKYIEHKGRTDEIQKLENKLDK